MTNSSRVVLKESMHETKNFIHKIFQNFKSSFHQGYKKLPKATQCIPSCGGNGFKDHRMDQFHIDSCNEWDSSLDQARTLSQLCSHVSPLESMRGEDVCGGSFMKFDKQTRSRNKIEARERNASSKIGCAHSGKAQLCSRDIDGGNMELARKMKELEMMDVGDVEHVLDVEEAMHYYSRLKSPVYLDIVDNFFKDMYSGVSVPRASVSTDRSKRRFGSIRL